MQLEYILAIAVGVPLALFVTLFIWFGVASGLYQVTRDAMLRKNATGRQMTSSAGGRVIYFIVALLMAVFMPVLIWVTAGAAFYQFSRAASAKRATAETQKELASVTVKTEA